MLKKKHKEAGVGVYQKIPLLASGVGALTQASPAPLPNKPSQELSPAPNNCAEASILSMETPVIRVHQNSHSKCVWLLTADTTCTHLLRSSVATADPVLINWPGRYLGLYSGTHAGEE